LLKLDYVTGENIAIQAELGRPEQEIVGGQLAAKHRDHLTERIPPAFRVRLWPEERNDRVAAQPATSVGGEKS
jgi:hypothetical protein